MFVSQKGQGPAEDFPQTEILMKNLLLPGLHKAPHISVCIFQTWQDLALEYITYYMSLNSIMHAHIWNESDVYLKVKECCDDINVPQKMIIKIDQHIVMTNKVWKFLAVTFGL